MSGAGCCNHGMRLLHFDIFPWPSPHRLCSGFTMSLRGYLVYYLVYLSPFLFCLLMQHVCERLHFGMDRMQYLTLSSWYQ